MNAFRHRHPKWHTRHRSRRVRWQALAKDFRFFNRVGLTLSGDLFNAPNKRTVLQRNTLVLSNVPSVFPSVSASIFFLPSIAQTFSKLPDT
jgi:hypothetical protein